jgi:hypothetical protein
MYMQGLQARVTDSQAHLSSSSLKVETYEAIKQGHREELDGLKNRLRVLLLIPFFFISPRNDRPAPVDARSILDPMAIVTEQAEARIRAPKTKGREFWNRGTTVIAWFAIVEAHLTSLTKNWDVEEPNSKRLALPSSWTSIATSGSLYFGIVLSLWQPEIIRGLRLTPYLCRTVLHDLLETRKAMPQWNSAHQRLWFWKAFVIGLSLSVEGTEDRTPGVVILETQTRQCIQEWSIATGVTAWQDAREALVSMVWPKYLQLEAEAVKLWTDSVSQPIVA